VSAVIVRSKGLSLSVDEVERERRLREGIGQVEVPMGIPEILVCMFG